MDVTALPLEARAVSAFNPTAPQPGFLQPLLVGTGGDNRSYVQTLLSPDRIAGFAEIAWPDRDFISLQEETQLTVDGPALWAFHFPGEPPLVGFWQEFRDALGARINDPQLTAHPLLQFDIVDTLGLEEAKAHVFTRAYRAYAAMGHEAADRWRDRAILEPAIARLFARLNVEPRPGGAVQRIGDPASDDFAWLRARTLRDRIEVQATGLNARQEQALQRSYDELAMQLPELFPKGAGVVLRAPVPRPVPHEPKTGDIQVVLVGRMRPSVVQRRQWGDRGIDVVDEAYFQPPSRPGSHRLTVILGAQPEWRLLVEWGERIDPATALIVAFSTSASPLVKDLDFQAQTQLRTLCFFAPYATSTLGLRDPVQPLGPVLEILLDEIRRGGRQALRRVFPAQHNMLIREPVAIGQAPLEVSCRIGARALKAGAVLDGPARIYALGHLPWPGGFATEALGKLFAAHADRQPDHLPARRPALMLLVERLSRYDPQMMIEEQRQGVLRLFEMNGWNIFEEREWGFQIGGPDRRFDVMLVDNPRAAPAEDPNAPVPGLTRAPLLVVHMSPRRDALLTGNRGQYFHVAIEDIALMTPDTPWVWAVVRRQLLEGNPRPTQAALRFSAVLVAEAIRQGRIIDPSTADADWKQIHELLVGADCERFVHFVNEKPARARMSLSIQSGTMPREIVIDLYIEGDGPTIQATIVDRLPFNRSTA
jgi:hypothetical protein